MQIRFLTGALALLSACAFAASPAPQPIKPNALRVTQIHADGSTTVRSLAVPASAKDFAYTERLISGQRRFILGGQWVQFPNADGRVFPDWIFPAAVCPPLPADASQTMDCSVTNPGTTGTWVQTHGWVQTPPLQGCVVSALPWTPTVAPEGACTPVQPPQGLQPPLNQTQLLALTKPARGAQFATQFATTETRVTDHAVDRPSSELARNDYSRRQPFNADKSRIVVYEAGGPWLVYKVPGNTFEKVLNGPGGDAEVQWSPTNPDKLYFMPGNGGTRIFELTVSTNTFTTFYDFGSQVQAVLGPLADRCWTRSEGSPSADNSRWGFTCQHYNQSTGNFDTQGYVVLDVVAHTVLWSKVTTADVDHVSMTPSGRSFVTSGDQEIAYQIGTSAFCVLRPSGGEHSDIGVMPNGHDFIVTVDFQTNNGDVFYIDIDQCYANGGVPQRVVVTHVYNNPWLGPHYSEHFSAKAFNRPGFFTMAGYGYSPAPILAYDMTSASWYGVGVTMANDSNYFDEVQAAISRDGKSLLFNDNFGTSLNVDAYRIDLP